MSTLTRAAAVILAIATGGLGTGMVSGCNGTAEASHEGRRDRFVHRMERDLRDVDDQIESLDEMIAAKREQWGDDDDEMIVEAAAAMSRARDLLEEHRRHARDSLARARTATEEQWSQVARESRTALDELEHAYQETVQHFYR